MKSLKHKRLLAGFMAMVFAIGAIIPANLPVHASSTTELVDTVNDILILHVFGV